MPESRTAHTMSVPDAENARWQASDFTVLIETVVSGWIAVDSHMRNMAGRAVGLFTSAKISVCASEAKRYGWVAPSMLRTMASRVRGKVTVAIAAATMS